MPKYRKKPVVVDAFQLTGSLYQAFPDWMPMEAWDSEVSEGKCAVLINTLEGQMKAQPGDWIIRGVEGEVYPCKASIFEATYEKVE